MKKQQSFKYFISKLYLISVALILAFVFYIIYHSVKYYIYDGIDNDLVKEWNVHKNEVEYKDNQLKIIHLKEWEEREHQSLEVNPVFVAFYNINGKLIEKSPNLKGFNLVLNKNLPEIRIENHKASIYNIRQIQKPIYYENEKIGYLCVALAIDNINILLDKLTLILILRHF